MRKKITTVFFLHKFQKNSINWKSNECRIRICGWSLAGSIDHVEDILSSLACKGFGALKDAILPVHSQDWVFLNHFVEALH